MDGKGFMGINVEDKQELSSENCNGARQMIPGFDTKMVKGFSGNTCWRCILTFRFSYSFQYFWYA
jgi:hypothetical protein